MTSFLAYCLLAIAAFNVLLQRVTAEAASRQIHVSKEQCRMVTSLISNQVECSAGEMVVVGGGSCTASTLSASAPLPSLQGWRVSCVDGAIPSSVTAQCCQAATDTTQVNSFVLGSNPLPSGSFLRGCVWMNNFNMQLNAGSAQASVQCPVNLTAVVGGGECPNGWSLAASYSSADNVWSIQCSAAPATRPLMSMTQANSLCCEAIGTEICQVKSIVNVKRTTHELTRLNLVESAHEDTLPPAVDAPELLAYCDNSSHMLLAPSFDCGDYAALTVMSIFRPFSLNSALLSTCAASNGTVSSPARISYQCCPMLVSPSPLTSNYCPSLPARAISALSTVTSSNPQAPLAYGSSYHLTCDQQALGQFHMIGNDMTVCQMDGTWSNNGQLGQCLALDTSECTHVQSSGQAGADSTLLSCPVAAAGDAPWVLVTAAGLCQASVTTELSQLHILHESPASLSSWESTCSDNTTQLAQGAALITGVCCRARQASVFASCVFVNDSGSDGRICPEGKSVLNQANDPTVQSAICCALSRRSCTTVDRTIASVPSSDLLVLNETCPVGFMMAHTQSIPSPVTGAFVNMQSGVLSFEQRWSKTVFAWNRSIDELASGADQSCCPIQSLCSWNVVGSQAMDKLRTPTHWPARGSVPFYCKPGYATSAGVNSQDVSCIAGELVDIPACFATRCSAINSSALHNATVGSVFQIVKTSAKIECLPGLVINGTSDTHVSVQCTGSLAADGMDWQPSVDTVRCVQPVEVDMTGGRTLLAVGGLDGTANLDLQTEWLSPYVLSLKWKPTNGDTAFKLLFDALQVSDEWDQYAYWRVAWELTWPSAEFDITGKTVVAAVSGLSSPKGFTVPYATESNTLVIDTMNFVEGVQGTVTFYAQVFEMEESKWDAITPNSQLFVVRTTDASDSSKVYCLYATALTGGVLGVTEDCPADDPRYLWTIGAGLLRNDGTNLCISSAYNYLPFGPCDDTAFSVSAYGDGMTGHLSFTITAPMTTYVTCTAGACGMCGNCSPPPVIPSIIKQRSELPVDTVSVTSPYGCDMGQGLPKELALYQNVGQDAALRIRFSPQSFANNEFTVFEVLDRGLERQMDIPNIEAFLFETQASCDHSWDITTSAELETLVWNTTSIERTFCLDPVSRLICSSCVSQYVPGSTAPGDRSCKKYTPVYWFSLLGEVRTSGGVTGTTAPVPHVTLNIQVLIRSNSSVTQEWSNKPLLSMSSVTDNNGQWSAVPSGVFSTPPEQFYDVLVRPSRVDYYMDLQPTMLFNTSGRNTISQFGIDESISISVNLTQQSNNVTTTTIEAASLWQCPEPSGNVTRPIVFICNMTSATSIQVTVRVNASTAVATGISYSSVDSPLFTETSTYEYYYSYMWSLPWNISFHAKLVSPSTNPLINQAVFGLNITNPYNFSETISAVPYMMSDQGLWLSPVVLANLSLSNNQQVWQSTSTLIIPPSSDSSQSVCWPTCAFDPNSINIVQSLVTGTSSPVYGRATKLPDLAGDIVKSEVILVTSASQSWFKLQLATGTQVSFSESQVQTVNSTVAPYDGYGTIVTDPTVDIVVQLTGVTLADVISWLNTSASSAFSYSSGLRASPSLNATLSIHNCSAVFNGPVPTTGSTPAPTAGSDIITSVDMSTLAGGAVPFRLLSAVSPSRCLGAACVAGARVSLMNCSAPQGSVNWKHGSSGLILQNCPQALTLVYDENPYVAASVPVNQGFVRHRNSLNFKRSINISLTAALPLSNNFVNLMNNRAESVTADASFPQTTFGSAVRTGNNGVSLSSIVTTPSFTYSIWFNSTETPSAVYPWTFVSSPGVLQVTSLSMGVTSTGYLFMGLGLSDLKQYGHPQFYTAQLSRQIPSYQNNRWFHVSFRFDEITKKGAIFLNGALLVEGTLSTPWQAGSTLSLGWQSDVSYSFKGSLKCFGAWNSSLTSHDIAKLFTNQAAGQCQQASRWTYTESNTGCLSSDFTVSNAYVGIRPCSIPSSSRGINIDPHQHWISSIPGSQVVSPTAVNRSLIHQFSSLTGYDNNPISQVTRTYAQETLAWISHVDLSTASVSGVVSIAPNALMPNVSLCGMPNIVVEAFATDDQQFEHPLVTSTVTDGSGSWSIALPFHQQYVIRPSYENKDPQYKHVFLPASWPLTVQAYPVTNISFTDVTLSNLTLSLGGGLCNFNLGSVLPVLELPSCNNQRFPVVTQLFANTPLAYALPAVPMLFSPYPKLVPTQNILSPDEIASVNQYLTNKNRISVDLSASNVTVKLAYHSDAVVKIISPSAFAVPHCSDTKQNTFSILTQNTVVNISFNVYEMYGSSMCNNIDSTISRVWVRDQISGDASLPCYSGCPVDISYDGKRSLAYHSTRVGSPFFFLRSDGASFTRDLYFGIYATAEDEANKFSILSTGTFDFPGKDSLKLAPSGMLPIYILRRPPGGSSMAEFSGSFTISTDISLDVSTGLSSSYQYSMNLGGEFDVTLMTAPMGVGTSEPLFSTNFGVGVPGFAPVLPPLPQANDIKRTMVVPQLNPTIYSSGLDSALKTLYNPNNVKAPFTRRVGECSAISGLEQFGKPALSNPDGAAEKFADSEGSVLDDANPPGSALNPPRRRLLSGDIGCESSTEVSTGVGQSRTYGVGVSTTDDAAIIDGDGDMFLFMIQDVQLSYANVLVALRSYSSDTVPTQYINGPGTIKELPDACQVVNPFEKSTASSSGNSQLLWVSQWTIKQEIIPYSNTLAAQMLKNGPMDDVTKSYYDSIVMNAQNWYQLLNYSETLKQQAVPWPELLQHITINEKTSSSPTGPMRGDYSSPVYLEGGDLIVSFSGGMGSIEFTIDSEADQSVSASRSSERSGSSDMSLSLGLTAAGIGIDVDVDMSYSNSESISGSADSSASGARSMTFSFSDPDRGDAFDVMVKRDPIYGTPVFSTRAGRSRCRWEQGTVNRENLVPSFPSPTVNLQATQILYSTLTITSKLPTMAAHEEFSYYLNLNQQTNPLGLIVSANGVPMVQNGVQFTMEDRFLQAGVKIQIAIQVPAGLNVCDSVTDLEFRLTGICYEDVVSPHQYAYEPEVQPTLKVTVRC